MHEPNPTLAEFASSLMTSDNNDRTPNNGQAHLYSVDVGQLRTYTGERNGRTRLAFFSPPLDDPLSASASKW